jgi:hypothetical protein
LSNCFLMCLGSIVVILHQKTIHRQSKRLWYFSKFFDVLCGFFENKEQKMYIITSDNKIHCFGEDNMTPTQTFNITVINQKI